MPTEESSHPGRASDTDRLSRIRARVLDQARSRPSPTRAQLQNQVHGVVCVVVALALVLFLANGGIRAAPRPAHLVLTTALGSAVIALIAGGIALSQGRSMLGRSAAQLLCVALVTPTLLLAWKVFASSQTSGMMQEWSERPGLRCLGLSLVLALAPLIGLTWLRRESDPTHPHLAGAAIGTTVGAGVWVLVDLWCPVGYVPHLLLGHVLPLLLVIGAGAMAGGRMLAVRDQGAR